MLRWIENNVQFWGMADSTELYSTSVCLLWYQAGLTHRFSACSCGEKQAPAGVEHANAAEGSDDGASAMDLSDGYLASLMPDDVELYQKLFAIFEQRVRQAERQSGRMFWCTQV